MSINDIVYIREVLEKIFQQHETELEEAYIRGFNNGKLEGSREIYSALLKVNWPTGAELYGITWRVPDTLRHMLAASMLRKRALKDLERKAL